MLALKRRGEIQMNNKERLERPRPRPAVQGSTEHNPLWQSLAMRSGTLQTKLTIGKADDPYEREADHVADQVMRMPAPQSSGNSLSITPIIAHRAQRKCAECEEEEEEKGVLRRKESAAAGTPGAAPPIVDQTLNSPGQPLDEETRAYFEPRFGHDFSQVRIHTGGDAGSATHAVHARAFTVADQIAFAAGQYEPHSETGRRLLAHELTHTLQQAQNPGLGIQRDVAAGGCAVDNASATDTGTAAHNQIWVDLRMNGWPVKREAQIPRAYKGGEGPGETSYVGTRCPPASMSFGLADLYYFEKPVFQLADIKPHTGHARGLTEYDHYARRLKELMSRAVLGGLCPGEKEEIEDEGADLRQDEIFDRNYLDYYLINNAPRWQVEGDSGADRFRPAPLPSSIVPSEEQDAGPFINLEGSVPLVSLHLYYKNNEDGTVTYRCDDDDEDDEQDKRQRNAGVLVDEKTSAGSELGFLTVAELVEPLERERPAITAELRRLGPRATGDEYVLVATQGFFDRLVLKPMAERQSQFMEVTPPGQRDPGLGMLNAAALLAGVGSALHGLGAGVLIIGDVLLLTPAAVALPPAKAGGELVFLRSVTTAPPVQKAAKAAGVLLVATVFAPDSASAAEPQIVSVETLQALPVASLDGGERPGLFDQVTANGATYYVAGFAKAGK